jgi:hypothetical protein
MRIVVDTNVLVSASLKISSWPGSTLRWIGKYGGFLKTDATEKEAMAVLQRPHIAPKIAPFFLDDLRQVFAAAELVTTTLRTGTGKCRSAPRRLCKWRPHPATACPQQRQLEPRFDFDQPGLIRDGRLMSSKVQRAQIGTGKSVP